MVSLRRHRALALAAGGGVAFALTSPPTDFYPAVLIGLALLAASLRDAPTFWRAFGRGSAWGTAAGVVGLRFVPEVIQRFTPLGSAASYLALVLLAAAQSVSWALGAGLTSLLHRRARVPLEIAFAAGVFAALLVPAVFAWTPAGLVSPWPAFVQLGDVVGERGVSVLLAVSAALLARAAFALSSRARREAGATRAVLVPLAGASAIVAALGAHGALRMSAIARESEALPRVRVGLVNPAVPPLERWDAENYPRILATLRRLTIESEAQGAELTVWPEAAYPYPLSHQDHRAPRGPRAVAGGDVKGPVLFGLITRAPPVAIEHGAIAVDSYNSATLVTPDGTLQPTYDKLQLLWFGETIPGGEYFPWLRRTFQQSGALIPGAEPRALHLARDVGPALNMGVLNCYEDTLAGVGRRVGRALAPNLLVNVTNDAWFFGTAEPELHARLAAMRAVELRLDLVRAVNLGVTSWIDASGRVQARTDRLEPGVTLVTPAVRDGALTLYARFGDAPVAAALATVCAALGVRARRRKREAPGGLSKEAPGDSDGER